MVQSVELLLDERTDDAIRAVWAGLIEAGLPSAGRHRGASNAPHVTLTVAGSVSAEREGRLAQVMRELQWPLPITLGGLVVFGRGPFVLARLVVPSAQLLACQQAAAEIVADPDLPHAGPGRWTPHVTLARRVTAADLGRAATIGAAPELAGQAVAVRRWDGEAKREWMVAGGSTGVTSGWLRSESASAEDGWSG